MNLASLRSKARRNTLEVEHILAAVKAPSPGLSDGLRALAREYGWSVSTHLPDGTRVVPLGRWAEVAIAYLDGGMPALAPLAARADSNACVIGFLEGLHSAAALDALLTFFSGIMREPCTAPETAWRLVRAYDLLMSVGKPVLPVPKQAALVREFLVACLALAETQAHTAWVLYALRAVGDASSLERIAELEDLASPHQSAKTLAIRAIRQRERRKP